MSVIMEGILRATFAFIILLVLLRLTGKHNQSQLTLFDFVMGATIGGMGALMAAGFSLNVWGIFAALLTFIVLLLLNGYLSLESRPIRKILRREPVIVVHNGKILESNLMQTRFSADDLTDLLQEKGYFDLTKVEYAIIETNGELNIMSKS